MLYQISTETKRLPTLTFSIIKAIVESPSNGVIRKMFEEGALLKQKFGAENVYDFSIGNPDLDPPQKVCDAVKEVALDTTHLRHGYIYQLCYRICIYLCRRFRDYDRLIHLYSI